MILSKTRRAMTPIPAIEIEIFDDLNNISGDDVTFQVMLVSA